MRIAVVIGDATHGLSPAELQWHPVLNQLSDTISVCSAEDSLYFLDLPDWDLDDALERRNGWTETVPGEWADYGRGERGIWKRYGDIYLGTCALDIEEGRG